MRGGQCEALISGMHGCCQCGAQQDQHLVKEGMETDKKQRREGITQYLNFVGMRWDGSIQPIHESNTEIKVEYLTSSLPHLCN